ncbi:MAG: ABC transporter ATP-binding protein [Anaerolineales bacterium]|nr:ABC transporter ATP-binding protein [Anaerolineales bacterium]
MDILTIRNLSMNIHHHQDTFHILRGVNLRVPENSSLGIVGESGSGKTMTCLTTMRLLPKGSEITGGEILFRGKDICKNTEKQMEAIRGSQICMIFQDARAALNPVLTVGEQIADVYCHQTGNKKSVGLEKAAEVLDAMGLSNAQARVKSYPYELSGGMCQRVLIAMAMVSTPKLMIADEITSGLDVTIQTQVIELARSVADDLDASLIFVSHDIGVIMEACSDVAVMYSGIVLEQGDLDSVFRNPQSPYTEALLKCFEIGHGDRMNFIPGTAPDLRIIAPGCPFAPRCQFVMDICRIQVPEPRPAGPNHWVACHRGAPPTTHNELMEQ